MEHSMLQDLMSGDKYSKCAIRWLDKNDHYELIFTDDFVTPSSSGRKPDQSSGLSSLFGNSLLTDIITDMRGGDKDKEVHVFIGSFGGEVAALNMILQQLLTYRYRVGINLGTACSCGWMLLFACQERYVSTFSQAMYHDMSCFTGGKHSELQRNAEFMSRWQKELLKCTDTEKFLTEKEMELAQTSEVWFTGRELIERGAALDYNEYLKRQIPFPVHGAVRVGSDIYAKGFDGTWTRYVKSDDAPLTYPELLAKSKAAGDLQVGDNPKPQTTPENNSQPAENNTARLPRKKASVQNASGPDK